MDILNILATEIKDKHLTKDEAIRYIYLRTCEIFSYNSGHIYIEDKNIRNKIDDYKPDISNVENFEIICHNYSKYILKELIKELVGSPVTLINENDHSYITTIFNNEKYELDATYSDLMRVKMHLDTEGFRPINYLKNPYKEYLKEMDEDLGFDSHNYQNDIIQFNLSNSKITRSINIIGKLMKIYNLDTHFSDADYFIKYLLKRIAAKNMIESKVLIDFLYNLNRLYCVDEGFYKTYFYLYQNDKYVLKEITEDEVNTLKKQNIIFRG